MAYLNRFTPALILTGALLPFAGVLAGVPLLGTFAGLALVGLAGLADTAAQEATDA